ncbi:hypothetical protein MFLAVUS_003462 [Mucor flavus]|uniref:Uncharacterized protein n=1 Tax=Mucor flavus TaxID=439312 RepID=A0ABP9YT50_9FUNG
MAIKQLNNNKGLSVAGLSSVTANNTIYLYGDKKAYSNIWFIATKDISNNKSPTPFHQNNSLIIPDLAYSPGVVFNNSILAFNNVNNSAIVVYSFDLVSNHTWSSISTQPFNASARDYSISLAPTNDQIYLLGGTNATQDFWVYYTESNLWKPLLSPYTNTTRCGHTSSMLSDGRMIIIGGFTCPSSTPNELSLIPLTQLLIFNSNDSVWLTPPQIKGKPPSARTYHSAIVMNNKNDVFICGGQNETPMPFQIYMGSQLANLQDMSGIFDTNTWTWRTPKTSYLNQPYPQSNGILSIVNETKLVFGFGTNYHTVHDRLHIFDTVTETWQDTSITRLQDSILIENSSRLASKMNHTIFWVIMGCIIATIICSYFVAVWNFGFKKLHFKFLRSLKLIKREIWKPRIGEPGWAETSRLVLKLFFLLLFLYLILTLSNQVIHSPVIDQLSYESNPEMSIDVPDIKFCFDDWEGTPYIRCTTDFGTQCSDYITALPTLYPCFLFHPPTSFRLGQISGRLQSNGSFLKFDYYAQGQSGTQVQVDFYNKLHDPTLSVYNLTDVPFDWTDQHEQDLYLNPKGQLSKTSYAFNLGLINSVHFELIKRVSLSQGIWNYVGVSPSIKTRYEIETVETPEYFETMHDPSSGAPQPLGSLHIVPLSCQTKVLREQKAFAFINAMGIFGGLFGLLFSLQSCLFGYRPRSPWGYMHRWSFGNLRSSLMRGLQSNFFPQKPNDSVLNVNGSDPLNNNASYLLPTSPLEKKDKEVRMAQIEDRIHMLERLFQAYYIDDEIFRSLDNALKNDPSSSV